MFVSLYSEANKPKNQKIQSFFLLQWSNETFAVFCNPVEKELSHYFFKCAEDDCHARHITIWDQIVIGTSNSTTMLTVKLMCYSKITKSFSKTYLIS